MRLTKEERVEIVELYFQNNDSVVSVQRNYGRIFCNEASPSKKCIKALVLKPRQQKTNLVVAYIEMPVAIQELKRNITQEINSITPETLSKVMNSTD